jgi:hypothetical protein
MLRGRQCDDISQNKNAPSQFEAERFRGDDWQALIQNNGPRLFKK